MRLGPKTCSFLEKHLLSQRLLKQEPPTLDDSNSLQFPNSQTREKFEPKKHLKALVGTGSNGGSSLSRSPRDEGFADVVFVWMGLGWTKPVFSFNPFWTALMINDSGQIITNITTSAEVNLNCGLERESPQILLIQV